MSGAIPRNEHPLSPFPRNLEPRDEHCELLGSRARRYRAAMSPDALLRHFDALKPAPGGACLVMGVLNVTPDSFSDGGRFLGHAAAVRQGRRLAEDGADLIDVGGESTRPGSEPVDAGEQVRRVAPVVEALAGDGLAVSVDTTSARVARAALAAGACCVNDTSGGTDDPDLLPAAAEGRAAVVLMHRRGTPRTMQDDPRYADVAAEVAGHLADRVAAAVGAGLPAARVLADPGIGFGKTLGHNLALLRALPALAARFPVLLGASRKGFLGTLTGVADAAARDTATHATTAHAVQAGCAMVRVHNAAGARQVIAVTRAMLSGRVVAEPEAEG